MRFKVFITILVFIKCYSFLSFFFFLNSNQAISTEKFPNTCLISGFPRFSSTLISHEARNTILGATNQRKHVQLLSFPSLNVPGKWRSSV